MGRFRCIYQNGFDIPYGFNLIVPTVITFYMSLSISKPVILQVYLVSFSKLEATRYVAYINGVRGD